MKEIEEFIFYLKGKIIYEYGSMFGEEVRMFYEVVFFLFNFDVGSVLVLEDNKMEKNNLG